MTTLIHTYYLVVRSLRETWRQPAVEITNIFFPLFFFAVTVGSIGNVAGRAFGVDNYTGFQMPVAVLQAVAGASGAAGIGMISDMDKGYFDKLMLTPAPRLALVLGRLAADGVRTMLLAVFIGVAGILAGSGFATGPAGFVLMVLLSGMFGLAYSGFGVALALRTGSAQAAQLGFLLFFPLIFLSPAFAPKEVFADWLQVVATINPVTYVVQGMRDLVTEGWDAESLAGMLAAIVGLGIVTMSMVAWGYRARTA